MHTSDTVDMSLDKGSIICLELSKNVLRVICKYVNVTDRYTLKRHTGNIHTVPETPVLC